MKTPIRLFLFWAPRIAGLLLALFLSVFALDVFGEGRGFRETAWALLMHLVPTGIVLAVLAVAWRWAWVGALFFPGLGMWYAVMNLSHPSWILTISGPLFLTGGLFLLSWLYRKELRGRAA